MATTCACDLAVLARILTDHELLNVLGNHVEPDVLRPSSSLSGSAPNSVSGVTESPGSVGHGEWD